MSEDNNKCNENGVNEKYKFWQAHVCAWEESEISTPSAGIRVYLALGNGDMRKSINGLSILVEGGLSLDPFSGHLFVFTNRRRNILKILYWKD